MVSAHPVSPETVVLFIESNTTGTGPKFAESARRHGHRPIFLVADPARYPFLRRDGFAWECTNTDNMDALLSTCHRIRARTSANGAETKVVGVTTSSDHYLRAAVACAQALGVPAPPPDAILHCRDKDIQRYVLDVARVPQPAWIVVESAVAAVRAGRRLGYPCVLKRVRGSGKVDVRLIETPDALYQQADALLSRHTNERGQKIPNRLLVEEYVTGDEYSCEVLDDRVIGITRKYVSAPPYFIEMGHDFPAPHSSGAPDHLGRCEYWDEHDDAAVAKVALRAVRALGLESWPAHVEIRAGAHGPKLIEVNPRLAGGCIPELVRLSFGIDMIDAVVQMAYGNRPLLEPRKHRSASIRFLVPERDGILTRFEGIEEMRENPHVYAIETYMRPGDQYVARGDFRDRVGHIITVADTHEIAAETADRAVHTVRPIIQTLPTSRPLERAS